MKLMKKMTYPAYPVDIITDVVLNDAAGNVLYRSHSFDRPDKFIWKKMAKTKYYSRRCATTWTTIIKTTLLPCK